MPHWGQVYRWLLRATYDLVMWIGRNYRWELLLTATGAVTAGVIESVDSEPVLTVVTRSLMAGVAALGLLWFLAWIGFLMKAPEALRQRELRRRHLPVATVRGRVRGATSELALDAMLLVDQVRAFEDLRSKLLGHGPDDNQTVRDRHRQLLQAIERFGDRAAKAGHEQESPSRRRRALSMYEEIRGFALESDLGLIEDRIRAYAIPPVPAWQKLREAIEDRFWTIEAKIR